MMTESKVGERLGERLAPEITQYLYGPRIRDALKTDFSNMSAVNKAHVVMLERQGIIKTDVARQLLKAIVEVDHAGPDNLELDEEREDLYFNYERAVIEKTSPAIGGQMHTGRSRNDLGSTTLRMHWREVILEIIQDLVVLRRKLLERAEEHVATIMPGYTHLQPAQPITLGHYLTAIEQGLARDTQRMVGALERSDYCPLGAGAMAGTGFPIDRGLTARLLGFKAPLANTLDAVATRDFLLEALAAGSILGVTLSRFAQDLYVWYTYEFGMIDFRDRVAGTSSIMPQKKNPILAEFMKGRASQIIGALATAIAGVKNTNYTNTMDGGREAFRLVGHGLEHLHVTLVLARLAVENMIVNRELMAERCRFNFSTVTQLADTLVSQWDLSFRQAHEIVGGTVRRAMEQGLHAPGISAELVQEVAESVGHERRDLDPELVQQALDPRHNVELRNHLGGPATQAVLEMIARGIQGTAEDQENVQQVEQRWQAARDELACYVQEYVE